MKKITIISYEVCKKDETHHYNCNISCTCSDIEQFKQSIKRNYEGEVDVFLTFKEKEDADTTNITT